MGLLEGMYIGEYWTLNANATPNYTVLMENNIWSNIFITCIANVITSAIIVITLIWAQSYCAIRPPEQFRASIIIIATVWLGQMLKIWNCIIYFRSGDDLKHHYYADIYELYSLLKAEAFIFIAQMVTTSIFSLIYIYYRVTAVQMRRRMSSISWNSVNIDPYGYD